MNQVEWRNCNGDWFYWIGSMGAAMVPNLVKDVNLALDAAKAKHAVLPAAEIVQENLNKAVEQGLGSKDWSALAKTSRRQAGLEEDVA